MLAVVSRAIYVTLCSLLILLALMVFLQVVFRFVLQSPLSWTEELSRAMLAWMTFLGGFLAMREGKNIGFGLLVSFFPKPVGLGLRIAGRVIVVGLMLVLLIEGVRYAANALDAPLPFTGISYGWFVYSVIPFSAALMAIQGVLDIVAMVRGASAQTGATT